MFRFVACSLVLTGAALLAGCPPSAEDCQPGTFWDANTEMCVAQNNPPQCPPGQMWNGTACAPAGGTQCPAGTAWNGTQCAPASGGQCPAGQTWNGSACVPQSGGMAQGCTGQAQPVAVGGIEPAVKLAAAQQIPAGAQPVGGTIAGNFSPGQCLEQTINIEFGKCYTVVGAGLGPQDVDLELVPSVGIPGLPPAPAVATDQDNGPNPVIGAKPNCFTPMAPVPMKLVIRVESGQGLAGAQVYAK